MTGEPPRFPAESPVQAMRMVREIEPGEGGVLILPGLARWALGLNEGDLLAVEEQGWHGGRMRFHVYAGRLWGLHEAVSHPWPYVEELLRLPMAAVGPAGALSLPEPLAERMGGPAVLSAWVEPGGRGFSLEPREGGRVRRELWAQARYRLPVGPDLRVRLPADALWALSAREEMVAVPDSLLLTPRLEPGSRLALIVSVSLEGASLRVESEPDL